VIADRKWPNVHILSLKKDKKRRPSSRRYQKAFGERRVGRDREFLLCLFFIKQSLCQAAVPLLFICILLCRHRANLFVLGILFQLILQGPQRNAKDISSFLPVPFGFFQCFLNCFPLYLLKRL